MLLLLSLLSFWGKHLDATKKIAFNNNGGNLFNESLLSDISITGKNGYILLMKISINCRCSEIGGNIKAPSRFKYSVKFGLSSSIEVVEVAVSILGELLQGLNNPNLSPSKHRNLSVLKNDAIG